jgi:hypothetical protein
VPASIVAVTTTAGFRGLPVVRLNLISAVDAAGEFASVALIRIPRRRIRRDVSGRGGTRVIVWRRVAI